MKLWIYVVVTLFVQELISTNVVLLDAHEHGYSFWIISFIFLIGTSCGVGVGYKIGKIIQAKFKHTKGVAYSQKKIKSIETVLGKFGKRAALLFLGIINFVYVNAFIASWLDLSFTEVFIILVAGDLIWYAFQWLVILGVSAFFNAYYALYILLGVSIVLSATVTFINRKIFD